MNPKLELLLKSLFFSVLDAFFAWLLLHDTLHLNYLEFLSLSFWGKWVVTTALILRDDKKELESLKSIFR